MRPADLEEFVGRLVVITDQDGRDFCGTLTWLSSDGLFQFVDWARRVVNAETEKLRNVRLATPGEKQAFSDL